MSIKLKVENTVRWRWSKDEFGQDVSSCISVALPYMRYPCFPLLGHLLTVCVLLIRNADTMSPFRGGNLIAESLGGRTAPCLSSLERSYSTYPNPSILRAPFRDKRSGAAVALSHIHNPLKPSPPLPSRSLKMPCPVQDTPRVSPTSSPSTSALRYSNVRLSSLDTCQSALPACSRRPIACLCGPSARSTRASHAYA